MRINPHPDQNETGSIRSVVVVAAVALAGFIVLVRLVAVDTENVNWDEFALLHRAVMTLRSGVLMGGGRPGLGTLLLLPFAAECRNAVEALVHARLLWTGMVLVAAAALWFLLRAVLPPHRLRWVAVATGVSIWALAAPFLRFSIEVRTDQPAIMFGLLGGLALIGSRRKMYLAGVAGILFGAGFLFSQKLLYVGGLVGVLTVGQLLVHDNLRLRREALRAAIAAVCFLLIVLMYRQVMEVTGSTPSMLRVASSLDVFEYYRRVHGWRL